MKYFAKILFCLGILPCFIDTASADVICTKILNKNGKLSLSSKQVIGEKCPKGFSLIANSATFAGPAGATGTAGAAGLQGAAGPQGARGTSSLNLTALIFAESSTGTIFDFGHRLLRSVGNYTKISSTSKLKLTLSSHVTLINDGTNSGFCDISLLVNSKTLDGVVLPSFSSAGGGTANFGTFEANATTSHPATVTGVISGLAAGVHSIGIGYRGSSLSSCEINDGNYSAHLYIEEVETT